MHVVAGIYYELPDGRIAYTYGFNSVKGTVSYRMEDDVGGRTATYAEVGVWTQRRDLMDFPKARDPRLPNVFCLNWDLKYTSELNTAIRSGHKDAASMIELAASKGIVLEQAPRKKTTRSDAEPAKIVEDLVASLPGSGDMQSISLLKELLKQFHINDAGHLQWSYMETSVAEVVGAEMEAQMLEIRGPEDYLR